MPRYGSKWQGLKIKKDNGDKHRHFGAFIAKTSRLKPATSPDQGSKLAPAASLLPEAAASSRPAASGTSLLAAQLLDKAGRKMLDTTWGTEIPQTLLQKPAWGHSDAKVSSVGIIDSAICTGNRPSVTVAPVFHGFIIPKVEIFLRMSY